MTIAGLLEFPVSQIDVTHIQDSFAWECLDCLDDILHFHWMVSYSVIFVVLTFFFFTQHTFSYFVCILPGLSFFSDVGSKQWSPLHLSPVCVLLSC